MMCKQAISPYPFPKAQLRSPIKQETLDGATAHLSAKKGDDNEGLQEITNASRRATVMHQR